MRLKLLLLGTVAGIILPLGASALEGIGPRVTVTGIVQEVRISQKQAFDQVGAEVVVKATNGQLVTMVITSDTQIVSEGKLSRRQMIPADIVVGMQVRVRGWRVDSQTLTASLFIVMNVSLNPALSDNGILQSINGGNITVLGQDGLVRSYSITNETEVNINYALNGADAMSLIGKQVLLTLNPTDPTQLRIIRVTGNKEIVRLKPTTVQLKMRD